MGMKNMKKQDDKSYEWLKHNKNPKLAAKHSIDMTYHYIYYFNFFLI